MRNIILIILTLTFSSCLVSKKSNYQAVQIKEKVKISEKKQNQKREEVIYNIYFNHDEKTITNNQNILFQSFHDSIMRNNTILSISIYGYCNEIGEDNYNKKLSEERAHCIYEAISKNTSCNIIIKGLGEIPNNNENIDKQLTSNRKVTISYAFNNISDVMPTSLTDLAEGEKMIVKNILFVSGLTDYLPESIPTLNKLLTDLKQNKEYHIQIQGHICDIHNYDKNIPRPSDERLLMLSENRAKAVYNYLVDNDIEASRLSFVGLQGQYPLHKEPKDDRRVEIKVTKIKV